MVLCRKATEVDVPTLESIRRDAILKLAALVLGNDYAIDWVESAKPNRILRAVVTNDVQVAELDHCIVGWVEVVGNRIAALYVSPGCSGQGVGKRLLSEAEALIRGTGFDRVILEASGNAEDFYLRFGYEKDANCERSEVQPMFKRLRD